jgi:hypothetical protein
MHFPCELGGVFRWEGFNLSFAPTVVYLHIGWWLFEEGGCVSASARGTIVAIAEVSAPFLSNSPAVFHFYRQRSSLA